MANTSGPPGRIPITVVSGPLGAGKTTLVNRLLNKPGGRRIAVIVNDVGEVNIDAELIEGETDEGVIDLSNGCICCRLQGDLVSEAIRLASEHAFDYLLVEASGISEPLPIARALTTADAAVAADPTEVYRLDTTVSVIDAFGFWKAFVQGERLPDAAPDPERPLTDVLIDQIEFCDVLLLNKCDMVPDDELDGVEAAIGELQPRAGLHRTTHCNVEPEIVLGTGRFDFKRARSAPGWKQALATTRNDGHNHDHTTDKDGQSAAAAHGVGSVVYDRTTPFHPKRLDAWLNDWDGDIVRAKGFMWVASRPTKVIGLSQAGPSVQAGPIGEWGTDDPATRLVFIGQDLERDRLFSELDNCLATDEEQAEGFDADPFPREQ